MKIEGKRMKDDMALKELYGIFGSNNPDFAREGLKLVLNQNGLEKLGKHGSPHAAAAMFGITLRMAMEMGYPNETVELHKRSILHKVLKHTSWTLPDKMLLRKKL